MGLNIMAYSELYEYQMNTVSHLDIEVKIIHTRSQ
jgi:hypothetical protein